MSKPGIVSTAAFWVELEKIAEEQSLGQRAMMAAPAVGAVAGGIAGYRMPHLLDPTAFEVGASKVKGRGRLLAGLLGAGTGATLGWMPQVARDFKNSVMPSKTAAALGKMLSEIKLPKPPAASGLTAAADVVKPVRPAEIKVPVGVRAGAGTSSNVTNLKAPAAIYG